MVSDCGDSRPVIVVAGNGMVGHEFCEKLVSHGGNEKYQIIVFGEEPRSAYDRVNLSKFFTGTSAADLQLKTPSWYSEKGIELRTGVRVSRINRGAKTIILGAGEVVRYDKLVLATGSQPFVPPIEGTDLPGVFVYRTIEDLVAIQKYSRNVDSGAVIGGGLLGLEAAKALTDLNLKTHVIEVAPSLMPKQLDAQAAKRLQTAIEQMGIDIHLLSRTTSIVARESERVVQFDQGDELSVGMIVISAGIRPRDNLAKACRLDTGKRGGIIVDDRLQTSDPNIFAIGECAAHRGTVYGLVGPGYQMADVLAQNLTGGKATFEKGDQSAKLKLLGTDVATLGEPIGQVPNVATIDSDTDEGYRKLILYKNRVVGAISVGPWQERDRVQQAIAARRRIWPWNRASFESTGLLWRPGKHGTVAEWPESATVCSCKNICRGVLTLACKSGCTTVDSLAERTGASTVCGSCRPLLAELVDAPEVTLYKQRPGLVIATVAAMVIASLWIVVGKLPFAESVTGYWHRLDFIWRDSFWKQFTGYTLMGIASLGLLLPLRKRFSWFSFGDYGIWRTIHAVVGTMTLVGLIVHTGMSLGANLNLMLSLTFLAINFTGIVVAIFTSMESQARGELAFKVRNWRPRMARLHFWLLWPLPALLAIHIFCVYYY